MVYDVATATASPMTEENCNTEPWEADKNYDRPENIIGKIIAFFKSFVNWIKELFGFASDLVQEKTK